MTITSSPQQWGRAIIVLYRQKICHSKSAPCEHNSQDLSTEYHHHPNWREEHHYTVHEVQYNSTPCKGRSHEQTSVSMGSSAPRRIDQRPHQAKLSPHSRNQTWPSKTTESCRTAEHKQERTMKRRSTCPRDKRPADITTWRYGNANANEHSYDTAFIFNSTGRFVIGNTVSNTWSAR